MAWNWQKPDWPRFRWAATRLEKAEERFLLRSGMLLGTVRHLDDESRDILIIEAMSTEALTTSEIEGERLNRASLQSSIREQLGLGGTGPRAAPAEQGIGEMMVDLYRRFARPLDCDTLFAWHRMLMSGRRDLRDVGRYRTHEEPMRVVSSALDNPTVHFEAPPSSAVPGEMDRFIEWFNASAPEAAQSLPALTRAGIAHLYLVCIHPFEDGNGRIGRAIAEKVLAQTLGRPTLTALAATILIRRKEYYNALEAANRHNEITSWLAWFAGICLEAQQRTLAQVEFLIDKSRLLDRLKGTLNPRQEAALMRMLREGPTGFRGGLSAGNYISITQAAPATATRDLADLIEKGALTRTGERRHARYHLTIPLRPVPRTTIDESGVIIETERGEPGPQRP